MENDWFGEKNLGDLAQKVYECKKCKNENWGKSLAEFSGENIKPMFIYGKNKCNFLIVGHNPTYTNQKGRYTGKDFNDYKRYNQEFLDDGNKNNRYFLKIDDIIPKNLSSKFIYTDLVKCHQDKFYLVFSAIQNCKDYLKRQIELLRPKIVLCHGVWASIEIGKLFNLSSIYEKSYAQTKIDDKKITFIFMGQEYGIDEWSKLRVREQIENFMKEPD